MSVDSERWEFFVLEDVFSEIVIAKSEDRGVLSEGDIPFVGRSGENNGFQGYVNSQCITPGNCITVGMVGTFAPFYQKDDFVASQNILCLRYDGMNVYNALFLCTILRCLIKQKYSYNRPIQKNKFSKEVIKLPCTHDDKPDFEFMEQYIKSLNHYKRIMTASVSLGLELHQEQWQDFLIEDLFHIVKGKRLTKQDMVPGDVNYIGAISENNGVRQCIDAAKELLNPGNCITVNYNGSVGEAFYQKDSFWASDDVNILYAKGWNMNPYLAMFFCTIIKANRYRFSYGRKWTIDKMRKSVLRLPATEEGGPDFAFMEQYIRGLAYSDRIL